MYFILLFRRRLILSLNFRAKRGRGAIGSRMDETGPYVASLSNHNNDLSPPPEVRVKEEWERRVLGPEKPAFVKSESTEEPSDMSDMADDASHPKRHKSKDERKKAKSSEKTKRKEKKSKHRHHHRHHRRHHHRSRSREWLESASIYITYLELLFTHTLFIPSCIIPYRMLYQIKLFRPLISLFACLISYKHPFLSDTLMKFR